MKCRCGTTMQVVSRKPQIEEVKRWHRCPKCGYGVATVETVVEVLEVKVSQAHDFTPEVSPTETRIRALLSTRKTARQLAETLYLNRSTVYAWLKRLQEEKKITSTLTDNPTTRAHKAWDWVGE